MASIKSSHVDAANVLTLQLIDLAQETAREVSGYIITVYQSLSVLNKLRLQDSCRDPFGSATPQGRYLSIFFDLFDESVVPGEVGLKMDECAGLFRVRTKYEVGVIGSLLQGWMREEINAHLREHAPGISVRWFV